MISGFIFRCLEISSLVNTKKTVGTVAAIVCTLLYVLSQVDLIPEFIPVVGFLDDAAMLAIEPHKKFCKFNKRFDGDKS